jgi:glycosyltransferase involved in cell wall biosynthesis
LSPEKNLKFLINAFSHEKLSNFKLSIIGSGLLGDNLRSIAPHNVTFTEHLSHEKIHQAYIEHDVFILPSDSEPWGLVVEEALYYGLPVISSAKVGCVEDLILHYEAGELFDPYSMASLIDAILNVSREYGKFVASVNKIDFLKRDYLQIRSYTSILAKVSEL